jgi:hypothetical protein
VVIFGAIFWGLAYAILSQFLDNHTLRLLFIFGAAAFPVTGLLKIGVSMLLASLRPPEPDTQKLYRQTYWINAGMKALWIILFYHLIAKESPRPFLTLVVATLLFTMAIPENVFRLWTYREAPDRYNMFILYHSSLLDRVVIVTALLTALIFSVKFPIF